MSERDDIWKLAPRRGIVFCATCLVHGLYSPSIVWDGAPICREHIAEAIESGSGGQPVEAPPGGFAPSTLVLQ